MNVPSLPESAAGDPQRPAGSPVPPAPTRSRLRLATVGGIAAIAILGGGITAAAASSAPAGGAAVAAATGTEAPPSAVTSRLVPTGTAAPDPSASGTAAPRPAAPGTDGGKAATPPAPKVHQPHLDGTVTSVSGSTVLIKDREGFTRTIVESSTTTYRDGLKAALTVGSKIHAEGTVASNGTSLDATVIGADKGPAAGGPAGKGPGGPGGRPAGPRGADAPTPPAPGGTKVAPTQQSESSTAPSTMATTK